MRIGISLTSAYNVKDPRDGARWMIERTRGARAAGLDSLFIGDHHSTPYPYYQNTPMLGRLLAEWGSYSSATALGRKHWLGEGRKPARGNPRG